MILAFIMLTQCDKDKETFCTEEFVYGLNVTVKDADSSLTLIENVTVTARDGQYAEPLMTSEGLDSFFGAGERAGNYIIEVTADGYEDYASELIRVGENECHVIPEAIEIMLQSN